MKENPGTGTPPLQAGAKTLDDIAGRIAQARLIADAIVEKLGTSTKTKAARANIELMHVIVSRLALMTGDDTDDSNAQMITPREAALLSQSLVHLARAEKLIGAEREEKKSAPTGTTPFNADAASRALDVLGLTS